MNYWDKYFVFLSALQKSIRWCEINASRHFAQELMRMGKSVDVLNRLILIAAEDVGIADPSLILYERGCSDNFENLIKQYGIEKEDAIKFPELCEVVDRAVIAAAISYKSRLLPMASFATLWDIYENEDYSDNVYKYFDRFAVAVENRDEKRALYYAYVVGIFFNSMDRILTWVQRQGEERNDDLILQWVEEYKRKPELLVFAGSVVMLCRDLRFSHGEYCDSVSKYTSTPIKKAQIPNRAYDKHTRAGKRRGRGLEHFFNEAASVRNERFSNDWEMAGRNAYFLADEEGLGKAAKLIDAIEEKRKVPFALETI